MKITMVKAGPELTTASPRWLERGVGAAQRGPGKANSGGFQLGKWGYLHSWMVFVNGKILLFEMDDDWGYPYDSGNLHMYIMYIATDEDLEPVFENLT